LLKVLRGHLGSVGFSSFSPDGKKIVTSSEDHTGKIWDAQNGTILVDLKGHLQAVYYVNFSPDGKKIVTASADRTAKIWDVQSGKLLANLTGHTKLITNASFSPDGKKIVTSSFDSTVKIWEAETGKLSADLKGHTDRVLCALFSPDGKKIVTGAMDFTAKIWDAASGTILKELKSHTMWVVSACFSPDSKKIITASRDNTAKIWDAGNGNLMYSFFAFDSSEYLIVDKYNHYDGTAAARKILYFTCGTEIVELDQVKDQLWVPNLAERINDGESINAKKLSDLNICNLTPEVEDISSKEGEYHFTIKARQGGLGETVVLVNGIEAKRYKPTALMMNGGNYELIIQKSELNFFLIPGKENPVMVKARTADNTISSRGAIVTAGSDSISPTRPSLYTVMIGVSDYKGDELDLKFAAKDATDISNAVSNAAKKLLNTDGKEHVFMYNLTTDKEHYLLPEKNSIKKTLEEIGKKATANDILFIFFAGHGIMSTRTGTDREGLPAGQAEDKKQFYFLTADASKTSATDAIADVGISTAELTEWIKPQNIKAQKRILIFDACNSGQAIKDFVKMGEDNQNYMAARNDDKAQQIKAIDKLNEKSGLFILSASASNQNAYEMGRYSQGLLTYSLLKAIKQQPDILDDGKYLNISRWFNAVEKTVSDLSKESGARQEPQIVTNTNFNIGIVDDEVMAKIVLPMEKPLFTACNFQNNDEAIGDDDLELSKMINLQLNEIAARGTDSKIVYVTATNSPEAFALTGRYEVKENSLTVKVNVKQNKEIKYRFELRGTKDKLKELAAAISQKAATWAAEIK